MRKSFRHKIVVNRIYYVLRTAEVRQPRMCDHFKKAVAEGERYI